MKILLINRNDFVDGGADRVFINTYEMLQDAGGGLQVDKFTRADLSFEYQTDPRELSLWGKIRLVKDYLYNRKVGKSLEEKIQTFRPDVAHVHLIFGTLTISVLRVLKKHGVPVVMTVHDYRLICPANAMLDRHGKVCERCRGSKYYNCLVRRCSEGNVFFSGMLMMEGYMRKYLLMPIKLVNHFIFVSQFAKSKHLEFEPRYLAKSSHLYNMGIPVHQKPAQKGSYFLYFGRLSREKGLLTLMEAAGISGVRLIIAGSGPQENELRTKVRNMQPSVNGQTGSGSRQQSNASNISFAGFKSGLELQELIRDCSFVVVPSEWYENNPMAIIESFFMGKPVIGSRIGGIPELVNSDNGLLFDPENAKSLAEALLTAESMPVTAYDQMATSCQNFAEKNFDRNVHFKKLADIYHQVAELA